MLAQSWAGQASGDLAVFNHTEILKTGEWTFRLSLALLIWNELTATNDLALVVPDLALVVKLHASEILGIAFNQASDWNAIALDLQSRGNSPTNAPANANAVNSNPGTRQLAIQWIAVNDATVPLTGANNAYYANLAAPAVSGNLKTLAVQAAVAQASHDALVGTLGSLGFNAAQQSAWQTRLDTNLASSLSAIAASPSAAESSAITAGRQLGSTSASNILALRSTDGNDAPQNYTFASNPQPGQWILPTNSSATTANTPQWATVKPFALTSPGQFRSVAPPALSSAAYVTAVKTTQAYGYHANAAGTTTLSTGVLASPVNTGFDPVAANPGLNLLAPSDITNTQKVAAFWRQNPANPINEIARNLANSKNLSLSDKITLFEKLNVTLADARIAEWDTKYAFNFWRPYTAITLSKNGVAVPGLTTGNPDLTADPAWTAYLATPNHPSYGSGHTATGAGFEFLESYFGSNPGAFTVSSYSLDGTPFAGLTYDFTNFDDPRLANADSRIYAGLHFSFDNASADLLATQVGDYIFNNALVVPEPTALAVVAPGLMMLRRRRLRG